MSDQIAFVPVDSLRHIEGFSSKRVEWLREKIEREQVWTKPLALDRTHHLVMDGQHRMEVARALDLAVVPAVLFDYSDVEVWSLRPKYEFSWETVVQRSIANDPYPYKTVKHGFPVDLPNCSVPLDQLRRNPAT